MDILSQLAAWGGWAWIIAGLVLLALELVVPGGILVWLGVAGIITGLMALFQPIAWPFQWLVFGALSLVAVVGWQRYSLTRSKESEESRVNRGAERLIGQEGVLLEEVAGGYGRMALGDSVWRVTGPDLPKGHWVRIIGSQGPVLRVEPVERGLTSGSDAQSRGTGA